MNFSDLKSNKTMQSLVLVAALMLVLVVWSVFNITHVVGNRATLAQEKVLLADAQKQELALRELKSNENENREQIKEYQTLLPQSFHQEALLARLGAAAAEYNVRVSGVVFSDTVAEEEVSSVPFELNFSGEYESVMRFLESVALDGELVIIRDFTLAATEPGVEATAECSAYFAS